MTNPSDIIRYLLPYVATAGTYSSYIQGRVGTHAAKDGATMFHQALSDADLTIQGYLEVAILAKFPGISFFTEEYDKSLNAKYFPVGADLEVLIDPIDGTRCYIDNHPNYQIIIAIHDPVQIVGALIYMPKLDRCYIATKGEGAFVLTHEEALSGYRGTKISLHKKEGPVLVFNKPQWLERFSQHFEIRDVLDEYRMQPGQYQFTDILEGKALATIGSPCQAIDGGAIAFIASEAGAVVSDGEGNPLGSFRDSPKRVLPIVVTSTCPEVHKKILQVLR